MARMEPVSVSSATTMMASACPALPSAVVDQPRSVPMTTMETMFSL